MNKSGSSAGDHTPGAVTVETVSDSLSALVEFYLAFPEAIEPTLVQHRPDVRTLRCHGCTSATRDGHPWPCLTAVGANTAMDIIAELRQEAHCVSAASDA